MEFRYNWNWAILFTEPYFEWILSGITWTVLVSCAAWVLAFTLGSIVGIARTVDHPVVRAVAGGYVEFFRNIPLLVQMFLWYFVVPELLPAAAGTWVKRDLPLPQFWTAVVALGLYTSARTAEQVRAGIQSIGRGQIYAARAIGLAPVQVYRYVLLPVCYRIIIPPLTSDFMGVFKNSSLALTIGVMELTAQARQITEYTFHGFEAFTAATLLYLTVTFVVVTVMRWVEAKVHIPGTITIEEK
jgi:glutamate/aspartate transport system permease protein